MKESVAFFRMLYILEKIAAKIDKSSGSPVFSAQEHGVIEAVITMARSESD